VTIIDTDVLVVGGGLAALRAAYDALRGGARVTLAVKGKAARSGSSSMTSAGYSAALTEGDSPERHYVDTLDGGRGINNAQLVQIVSQEAPERLRELLGFGGVLALNDGKPVIHPSGDHSMARTVVAANYSGRDFTEPLARKVIELNCEVIETAAVTELLVHDGAVAGAICLAYGENPNLFLVRAPAVILGTGGAGRLFAVTSNPSDVTGDGYALALGAGAPLRDMEFIQFYPWRCIIPFDRSRMPVQPSTFVFGARLFNADGERFMDRYDPVRREATTRDVAARGIYDQIRFAKDVKGGVLLDVAQLSDDDWARSNPRLHRYFADTAVNFRDVEMILSPEAHFFMGGVVIDERAESRVSGLFAVGETAGGVHGANRLDSNALPETQVFGARAGREAATRASRSRAPVAAGVVREWENRWRSCAHAGGEDHFYAELRRELQEVMWHKLGIVRDAERLGQGLEDVRRLRGDLEGARPGSVRDLLRHREMENSLLVAESCFVAALARCESRGAHHRLDYPERNDESWLRVIEVQSDDVGNLRLHARPV